jgi:hypothetical protein
VARELGRVAVERAVEALDLGMVSGMDRLLFDFSRSYPAIPAVLKLAG